MKYRELKKNIGVCRRYSKMQFKKLLRKFKKNGMHENFGQTTINHINDYISKKMLYSDLSYNDYQDMLDDLKNFDTCIINILCGSYNKADNLEIASSLLDDYVFFEGVDFTKYNY